MNGLRVFIGYDPRERAAFDVAVDSLRRHASGSVTVIPLKLESLQQAGLYTRPISRRSGVMYDDLSTAPMATEFSNSRFLVPLLAQSGLALFVDCDVVFTDDVYKMLDEVNGKDFAVACVRHNYIPQTLQKMDGQVQTHYACKNWSSVMLFNCDHKRNKDLTLGMVNTLPGRMLHRFCWLDKNDIHGLSAGWNWLVGEQEKPATLRIAHFTLGGPWFADRDPQPHDEIWLEAKRNVAQSF
jgi:hypothetical protein